MSTIEEPLLEVKVKIKKQPGTPTNKEIVQTTNVTKTNVSKTISTTGNDSIKSKSKSNLKCDRYKLMIGVQKIDVFSFSKEE